MLSETWTWSYGIIGAVVGGALGLTPQFLALLKHQTETKTRKSAVRQLHEKYSDPLATSAFYVLERLREIISTDGRDHFLQTDSALTTFEDYKMKSTLYRLGVLLAWHRALRSEVFILRAAGKRESKRQGTVDTKLWELRRILSDGLEVEQWRIKKVAEVLDLEIKNLFEDGKIKVTHEAKILGQDVDVMVDRALHASKVHDLNGLRKADKKSLADNVVQRMYKYSADTKQAISRWEPCAQQIEKIIRALRIRQATIYSNWQDAIGELFLKNAESGIRAYDVIGYREFEKIYENGSAEEHIWIKRLRSLVEDLNKTVSPLEDYRFIVLQKVHWKCGEIMRELQAVSRKENSLMTQENVKAMVEKAVNHPISPDEYDFKILP